MPLVAVVVAIAVDTVAVGAAVAGTITGLGVAAAVGATIGAIGAVTGNKALSIAGAVIGAVGAIGSIAASAGVLDVPGSAPLFGPAPTGAAADVASVDTVGAMSGGGQLAASDITDTGLNAVDPTTGESLTQATTGADAAPTTAGDAAASGDTATQASAAANAASPAGAVPSGTELAPQDAAAVQASTQAAAASGTNNLGLSTTTDGNVQTLTGLGNTVPPATAATPGAVANPELGGSTGFSPGGASESIPQSQGLLGNLTGNTLTGSAASNALGITNDGSDDSVISQLADYAGKHQLISLGVLQAGGQLLSGAFSTLTPAQVTALDAQAAANNAQAALTQQQTANLAMPKAVASLAPVTGTPATLVPSAPTLGTTPGTASAAQGFINQAPQQPQVTGKPA